MRRGSTGIQAATVQQPGQQLGIGWYSHMCFERRHADIFDTPLRHTPPFSPPAITPRHCFLRHIAITPFSSPLPFSFDISFHAFQLSLSLYYSRLNFFEATFLLG